MKIIDYYFSVLSPFTYLAGDRLEVMAEQNGCSVRYKPFDIMAIFSLTGGVPPKQRHKSRQRYRLEDLSRISRLRRMPIKLHPRYWPTDPFPASCCIIDAAMQGGNTGLLVQELLASCWARDKDISQLEVIGDCLAAAGFDPGLAQADQAAAKARFGQYADDAARDGAFGSPTYMLNGEVFWGQDRLNHLEAILDGRLSPATDCL